NQVSLDELGYLLEGVEEADPGSQVRELARGFREAFSSALSTPADGAAESPLTPPIARAMVSFVGCDDKVDQAIARRVIPQLRESDPELFASTLLKLSGSHSGLETLVSDPKLLQASFDDYGANGKPLPLSGETLRQLMGARENIVM